jgi:hypothetical protein
VAESLWLLSADCGEPLSAGAAQVIRLSSLRALGVLPADTGSDLARAGLAAGFVFLPAGLLGMGSHAPAVAWV